MNIVITGATGQDGIFLIDKLLRETEGKIFACTRRKKNFDFNKLNYLDNKEEYSRVKIVELDFLNYQEVFNFLNDVNPNMLFNLMGPSSVKSFIDKPKEMEQIALSSFENIINSFINSRNFCNIFQSSSSEMYGYDSKKPFDENSKFEPISAYAKSKHNLHLKCEDLIKTYDWPIVSGIMFNHESEFRNSNFLIMNLIEKAIEIKNGVNQIVTLPSFQISRDWSYARDIAEAIFELAINNLSGSYVIGSGNSTSLEEISNYIFKKIGLDYNNYVKINSNELRHGEPINTLSNPSKIKQDIGWEASKDIYYVIDKMYDYKTHFKR